MPGRKNIFKKLDYDTLQIEEVNFLPPRFDGNHMFVILPVGVPSSYTKAKSMDGMDNRYDGHVWTKTLTTNITNDLGFFLLLQHVHRASLVNDTQFDGFTKDPFPVGGLVPLPL